MEECVFAGKFLHIHVRELVNEKGMPVHWEMAARPHDRKTQGVDLIAKANDEYIINIEKRYPVDSFVVGFPGGISETEDVVGQGLKELKEETGYIGLRDENLRLGPMTFVDPWKSSEKSQYLKVNADEESRTEQELEELEVISNVKVRKNYFLEDVQRVALENQAKIDSRTYAYGLGLLIGSKRK